MIGAWMLVGMAGCQGEGLTELRREASFARQWAMYRQCQAQNDFSRLLAIAAQMAVLAPETAADTETTSGWWRGIRGLQGVIAPLPSRTSVDSRALVTTCLARATELANKAAGDFVAERTNTAGADTRAADEAPTDANRFAVQGL